MGRHLSIEAASSNEEGFLVSRRGGCFNNAENEDVKKELPSR